MDIREYKEYIIEELKKKSVCSTNIMQTQWTVRCPFCGDSKKHMNHAHFTLLINRQDDTVPILYHCHRCGEGGLFDHGTADMLELDMTDEIHRICRSYNRSIQKSNRYVNKFADNKFVIPRFTKNQLHDRKLEYLSNRLGIDISYDMVQELSIILDIFEFIKCNNIESIPGVSFKLLSFLNYNYIGFLSSNKNLIINRQMGNDPKMYRYYKLTIDPNNFSTNKYFNIPSDIDLMYTDDIQINIAEGIMDIISIKLNLSKPNIPALYYAGCGFNYTSVLKYLIYNGICTGINLNIYSDNDKSDYEHEKYLLQGNLSPWLDHISIHRNQFYNEKDYGVPKDRIIDGVRILR